MTVFQSPSAGFTSLSWEPPQNWEKLTVKSRPGAHRLHTIFSLSLRDKAYYRVQLDETGSYVDLRVQCLLNRADGKIYHACGMINTRPGTGWHPYWAMFFFDKRVGGKLVVRSETAKFLRQ